MPFVPKKQAFNAHINEVVLGVGDKATAIGGQNVLPFHTFDAEIKNAPKIGVELTDLGMAEYTMPGEMKLIVNRAPNGELNPGVMEEINKYGLQLAGVLPQDDTVYTYDCEGKPSSQVPDTAPVKKALAAVMQELHL